MPLRSPPVHHPVNLLSTRSPQRLAFGHAPATTTQSSSAAYPLPPTRPPFTNGSPAKHPVTHCSAMGHPTVQQRVNLLSNRSPLFTNGSPRLPQTALPTPENAPNRPQSTARNTVSPPKIFAPTRSPALPPPNIRTPTAAQNPANQRHFRAARDRYPKTTSAPLLTSRADLRTLYKLRL